MSEDAPVNTGARGWPSDARAFLMVRGMQTKLHRWAAGQWATDVPHRLLPDGRLQQGAWLISRQVAADGTSPRVLILDHQKLNIRLVFDQFAPETEAAPTECEARTGAV